ncbi:MAG: DUF4350 domain-containing protein [Gemmatimonadales bacterium]
MRPRTEVALALLSLGALVALAAGVGQQRSRPDQVDPRASSYLSGPRGARGLAEALPQLGVQVERARQSYRKLAPADSSGRTLFAVIDPALPLSSGEGRQLLDWYSSPGGTDLLLAGTGSEEAMACFGYQPDLRSRDSAAVREPGEWPELGAVLAASDSVVTDSSRLEDAAVQSCTVPVPVRVDTLLTSRSGRALALRLRYQVPDRAVLLFADATLLRNRALRETAAGPWVLGLLRERYQRVIFDEGHQGFSSGGSLAEATLDWSLRSPFGWAAWQLALVGVLLLLSGAIRFGPVRRVISRKRRSPLEHVRALATALAAAKGHDVAIGAVVRGLRRRLMPAGQRSRADWREWVERLSQNVRSPRAREAAAALQSLTRPGQPPEGVLRAANAVEDVWEELRP